MKSLADASVSSDMARPPLYEAAGAVYHVIARGDGGKEGAYYRQLVDQVPILMNRISVPQKWIVENLAVGSAPYLSRLAKEMGQRIASGGRTMRRLRKAILPVAL